MYSIQCKLYTVHLTQCTMYIFDIFVINVHVYIDMMAPSSIMVVIYTPLCIRRYTLRYVSTPLCTPHVINPPPPVMYQPRYVPPTLLTPPPLCIPRWIH